MLHSVNLTNHVRLERKEQLFCFVHPRIVVQKTLSALRQFLSREICSPDIFSRQTLAALRVKDTFSPETLSVSTISALRHLRPWETFSLEKLSASRNFQPRTVWRHFQPQDSCSPKQFGDIFSPETISAPNSYFKSYSLQIFSIKTSQQLRKRNENLEICVNQAHLGKLKRSMS